MAFLTDSDIKQLIETTNLVIPKPSTELGRKNSPIQPASLDFTIGEMRVPSTNEGDTKPTDEVCLQPGAMVIVATEEKLTLPKNLGAITVSPVSQSIKGFLILNQGHVDPGFDGFMRFIIINMSQVTVPLRKGDIISSILFYDLTGDVSVGYSELNAADKLKGTPTGFYDNNSIPEHMITRFSNDFMHVDSRATDIATKIADDKIQKADIKITSRQIWLPLATAVVTLSILSVVLFFNPVDKKIDALNERLIKLEAQK